MRFPRGGLVVVAMALVHPAQGLAAVKRVALVVVATQEKAEREALQLQAAAGSLLGQDARVELIDPASVYAPAEPLGAAQQLAAARSALAEVEALAGSIEFAQAASRAELALEQMKSGDFRVLREPYLGLLVHLARFKRALGVDDGGAAELTRAFVIDPDLSLPRGLNTAEKAWFQEARKATLASSRAASVIIEGGPGWVWLDGRLKGSTPLTLTDVIPGRHFVTLAPLGGESQHRSELLGTLERITFSPGLTALGREYRALRASLVEGFRRGDPVEAATAFAAWAKVEEVLAVSVSADGLPRLLRVSAGGIVPVAELTAATPTAVADAALLALERKLVSPVAVPAQPAQPAAEARARPKAVPAPVASTAVPTPKFEPPKPRAAGVVLLSLAFAAAATGAVFAVLGQTTYDQARAIGVPQVTSSQGIQQANLYAYASIGSFGGAAVLGAIGLGTLW